MSLAQASRLDILRDRAWMLARCRKFFSEREVLEVDVPILSVTGSIDLHIDLIGANACGKKGYLHSSPEYGMRRLLSEGIGDIYQLSHVFRDSECGSRHNPEFTMCEWYRLGFTLDELMLETLDFIRLFLNVSEQEVLTYEEAFLKYAGKRPNEVEDQDHTLAFEIEPKIGRGKFTIIKDFPREQAALSRIEWNGSEYVAKRFEIFYQGMELANGYHELIDGDEQEMRLLASNQERKKIGKEEYPLDHAFLNALKQGLPDSCGVAVGFDRLMMLKNGAEHISEVIPFAWEK
jgi:lysyl-tRNA synthetase class 2